MGQNAVLNIILGIFIENAMKCVQREGHAMEFHMEENVVANELFELCKKADVDDDGMMNAKEWEVALQNPHLRAHLDALGLRFEDVSDFFRVMGSMEPDGMVPIGTFC